jgi:signal transduction histidine kinase
VIAHDLRSPLTSILASAQLAGREGLSPEQRERVTATETNQARRMNVMINHLVEAAQIGTGELTVQPEPMDLAALVRQVVDSRQIITTQHHLIVDALERLEGHWDPGRHEQVLDNLIGNAIKYSPDGGELRASVERQDGQVLVRVTDQGVGLRPEDLPRLFQLFSRLEPKGSIAGTGLGLHITRGIVEAHGGRIWAESAGRGHGSTFSMTLPLE